MVINAPNINKCTKGYPNKPRYFETDSTTKDQSYYSKKINMVKSERMKSCNKGIKKKI